MYIFKLLKKFTYKKIHAIYQFYQFKINVVHKWLLSAFATLSVRS